MNIVELSPQQRAAAALAELVDLAAARALYSPTWHIRYDGRIEAQLHRAHPADLEAWADVLGASVDWHRARSGGDAFPGFTSRWGGAPLTVWACIPTDTA